MNHFEKNILAIYKNKGKDWLEQLPQLVQEIATQWNLTDLKPFGNLTYNYILSGLHHAKPIILKIGHDHQELAQEVKTLEYFKSPYTVKVLKYQPGILLLEQAVPGNTLHSFFPDRDNESLTIACKLLQHLHTIPPSLKNSFPSLAERVALLDKKWNIPNKYLQKARVLKTQLLATASSSALLHGDFHHGNILQHNDSWIVIDPRAIVGDPAYEIAIFICNPPYELIALPQAEKYITQRVTLAAHLLSINPHRIQAWTFVHSVLAWAWSLEDERNVKEFEHLTNIRDPLTPRNLTIPSTFPIKIKTSHFQIKIVSL